MSADSNRETYLRLLSYVRPYWRWFAYGLGAMIVLALSEAAIPAVVKPLIDGTFVERDPTFLQWAPLGVIVLFAIRSASSFASDISFAAITTHVVYDLRVRMFDRLLDLPTRYYDENASGRIISKLTYDVTQVTQAGTTVLTVLVKDSLIVIALLGYLFWLDWQLSLFTFVLGPVIAGLAFVFGRRMRRISRTLQNSFGDLTHTLEEATRGHKVIKIFNGQDYERRRFGKTITRVRRLQFKFRVASSASVPAVEFVGSLVMAAIIYLGTNREAMDTLTVGGFVAFFGALALMFSPIKRLTKVNDPLQRGLAAADSIFRLLDEAGETDTGHTVPAQTFGRVEFEAVELQFPGAERKAVGPIDLEIAAGETVALVGPSGGGKTSIANMLPRLYDPTAGRILLDGVDLRDWPLRELRRQIAFVGQDVVLFNDTVAANIAYGSNADTTRIRDAARAAGALDFIEALPQGLDTQVGENGVRLSGGQRQRLAIARALLEDPHILILDEATSALDTSTERQIQAALETLRTGRTTLIIAHRLSTVEGADRILVLA
ncbi:MAG: lipid transporter ATP-binding protein and permease, partial [Pseudomonadota bacterium]